MIKRFIFLVLLFINNSVLSLNVITHNLALMDSELSLKELSKGLKEHDYDVLFLQEIKFSFIEKVREIFGPHIVIMSRPWDKESIAIVSKHLIYSSSSLKFSNQDREDFERVALMAYINLKKGLKIRFVNTHLAYRNGMEIVRAKQMKEILDWVSITEMDNPSDVVIIGGDLNATPDEPLLELLDDYSSFNRVYLPTYKLSSMRLDYFFIKANRLITGKEQFILRDKNYSDHETVLQNLNLDFTHSQLSK